MFLEDPWILFMTTLSQKRIHGSSTTSKTFRGVEYVRIFQLVINEEDEKIVNLWVSRESYQKKLVSLDTVGAGLSGPGAPEKWALDGLQ